MNALATIHVAKKQLGLDEDTYRAVLVRVTGKESAAAMDEAERKAVVIEFRRQGFKPALKARKRPNLGRFAKTFQAFWLDGYHLGVFRNRSDEALERFILSQVSVDAAAWANDAKAARSVIEALKAWLAREAGVKWPVREVDAHTRQLAVVEAQLRILGETRDLSAEPDLVAVMKQLGERIRRLKR